MLVMAHDLFVIMASFPVAMVVRQNFSLTANSIPALINGSVLLFLIASMVLVVGGSHRGMWRYASPGDLLAVLRGMTLIVLLFTAVMFFVARLDGVQRSVIFIFWLTACVGLCSTRLLYAYAVNNTNRFSIRKAIAGTKPVLLVGGGDVAALVISLIDRSFLQGYRIVGVVDNLSGTGRTIHNVPVLGRLEEVDNVISRLRSQGMAPAKLVFTTGRVDDRDAARISAVAGTHGIPTQQLTDLLSVSSVGNNRDIPQTVRGEPIRLDYWTAKRLADIALSSALLILFAPLMVVIAGAVRLCIGRPVVFDQVRPGRFGHDFMLHKFRTMHDPVGSNGRLMADAERTPWLGLFLRRTRMDELPQLLNVLVGEMSFVGPRPLLPHDLPPAGASALSKRASVRPGITGWAQVNGGQMLPAEAKIRYDLAYIRHANLLFDLYIVWRTLITVVIGEKIKTAS